MQMLTPIPQEMWLERETQWMHLQVLKITSSGDKTSKLRKNDHFRPHFETNSTFKLFSPHLFILYTNFVPYPSENVARNKMEAFSNSKNDVIWRYDVINM